MRSPHPPRLSGGGATVVRLVVPPRPSREGPQPPTGAEPAGAPRSAAATDEQLVEACKAGERWAAAELLTRFAPLVERLLRRVLGHDRELEDLTQEALATVLTSVHQVRDPAALRGWVAQIAVHTAHRAIRKRRLHRWLLFWAPRPELELPRTSAPARRSRVCTRCSGSCRPISASLALRFIEEMPLEDVARACGTSLATIKRRLSRAEKRFLALARRDPVLAARIEEGGRWASD
ncbi:MAG: sigma-70 family RNA polymerase sigma factor [Polyangiaceae bacterium]